MLAMAVELVAERYVATTYNDRDTTEWPPHPARLFSALVATWADGEPLSAAGEEELLALRWFERQPAPSLIASPEQDVARRTVAPVFVPVNDVAVIAPPSRAKLEAAEAAATGAGDERARAKAQKEVDKLRKKLAEDTKRAIAPPEKPSAEDEKNAARIFPERRTRQPRTFPSVWPACPSFAFVWSEAVPEDRLRAALARLCGRVVRLGHSSSFVHVRLVEPAVVEALERAAVRYMPDDEGDLVLRWVSVGQIERLRAAYDRHREVEPRVLPARYVRYREANAGEGAPELAQSLFGNAWTVFARVGGPRLPSTATAGVARQMRRALIAAADQPVCALLSGHDEDGGPSSSPHLAVVPLPFVGTGHADGAILGVALVLPRDATDVERKAVLRAIGRLEQQRRGEDPDETPAIPLMLGRAGVLELERIVWGEDRNVTLRASTWCRPARSWATATPLALDRNPGDLHDPDPRKRAAAFDEATRSVIAAVRRVVPLEPLTVDVLRSCVLPGTAKPVCFPRFPAEPDRTQRVLVHARIVFPEPVRGPLLVGAGRYQGLGLFRPEGEGPAGVRRTGEEDES